MNSIKVLNTLLNVILVLLIISVGVTIVFGVLFLTGVRSSIITSDTPLLNFTSDPLLYVFGGILLIVYVLFTFGVWQLRKAATIFLNDSFYASKVLKPLLLAGKSFVVAGIFAWLIDGLSSIHFGNQLAMSISDNTFIYLFITSIGLFIMLMSSVIEKAINLKNENDLTI